MEAIFGIGFVLMALILSINEEKDSLTLVERFLAGEGHRVISFEMVQKAVEWLKGHFPDLVLASGGRQGEKARETVRLLKKTGLPASKIFLLINQGAFASVGNELRIEVRGVISEPCDQGDLIRLINKEVGH